MTLPLAAILQKKVRSAITVLAVGIGVALLLVLVGLTRGSMNEVAERIQNVGADLLVQPAGSTSFLALKSGVLPARYAERLRELPGVAAVSPVVTWTVSFRDALYVVYGIDPSQFASIGGGLRMVAGRELRARGEAVVDSRLAAHAGLAAERGDAKARVVREGRQFRGRARVARLREGVLDKRVVRLVRLTDKPTEAQVLAPLVKREIIYRLLIGQQGDRLRHIAILSGYASPIARAIERLRKDFDQPLRIEDMARDLGMSEVAAEPFDRAAGHLSPDLFQRCCHRIITSAVYDHMRTLSRERCGYSQANPMR